MDEIYSRAWVDTQVSQTVSVWNASVLPVMGKGTQYSPNEQAHRERAYDESLEAVEQDLAISAPWTKDECIAAEDRLLRSFARFSANALDLEPETIKILTDDFIPVGSELAVRARRFDAELSMAGIIQACRNAWTACGLQAILGVPVELTPSILGYSLLYPYSDNYLDDLAVSSHAKLRFSRRFLSMLQGKKISPADDRETALRALIQLIEQQYPRACYPHVFDCLIAIHQAQEKSIQQTSKQDHPDPTELLRTSCGKGGTSVLADACLARGRLSGEESRFAFEWGVLLQLGDDLQDIHEDLRRGSMTLFSMTAVSGKPLDSLAIQLLNFGEKVAYRMDSLPEATPRLKALLKISWRSLIIRAVAESHEFFSPAFLKQAERCSPFRFAFLRARKDRLAGGEGLYAMLFERFLAARAEEEDGFAEAVPQPLTEIPA